MTFDRILVRFGEYTVKGRNRGRFERAMLKQVQAALEPFPRLTIVKTYGRIYIELDGEPYEPVAQRLKDVFGILSFSPVLRVDSELEAIQAGALEAMRSFPELNGTFKVSVKRTWKQFPHDSQAMNHLVGSHVLRAAPGLRVDVRRPQIELRVEIQSQDTYLYCQVERGAGGYPYGTNGKGLLLLSGGIDSPVAGWTAMRKGLELEAVHFHSFPFTSEQARDKVIELGRRLSHYGGQPIRLHLVPFTEIQTAIAAAKADPLIITLMRRSMLRIATHIAEKRGAMAIVTGDSLGQVASQTLGSLNVIGRETDLPILRPLIMMDKQEVIDQAVAIGTYDTSILPYEDCCTLFVPKSPSTNPNLRVTEAAEASIAGLRDMELKAAEETETMRLWHADEAAAGKDDWF